MKSFKLTKAAAIAASGLILSTLILILFHASWGFLVTSILLTMCLFNFRNPILNSFSSRAIVSLLIILASFQVEALLFAILHIHVNASVYALFAYLFSFIGVLTIRKKGHRISLPKLSAFDAIILVPAILISGLYTARVILPKEDNTTSIIRSMTLASDDSTHFSMYEDLMRSDSNLLSFTKDNHEMALQQQGYPMGWHLSASVITGSIAPELKNESMNAKLVSFFALKVMSIFLIIFVTTILVWQLATIILDKNKQGKLSTTLGLYFIIAFSFFFTVLQQFFEGFFSFLPIVIYSLLFILFSIELYSANKADRPKVHVALIASIICMATCWILTFPALLISYIFMNMAQLKKLRELNKTIFAAILACLLVFAAQCYILVSSTSESFSAISATGGIAIPDFTLFVILNIFLLFFVTKHKFASISKPLFITTLALYIVMAPILAYISLKSQVITYYFQKLEAVTFVLLMPVALVALFMYIQKLELLPHQKLNNSSALAALVALAIMAVPSTMGYSYFVNIVNRVHGYQLSHEDAAFIKSHVLSAKFNELKSRYYFYYPNNIPSSIFDSNIARMGYYNEGCQIALTQAAYGTASTYSAAVKTCKSADNITVVTDKKGEALLKSALENDKINTSRVKFMLGSS